MAEIEEPQFASLSDRIAALKQSQAKDNLSNGAAHAGKRPPPLRPTSEVPRPHLNSRSRTVNNPPIASVGSSMTKQTSIEPANAKPNGILPPPPIDRDTFKYSPPLPNRNGPPPLPTRKNSEQLTPSLPPRRTSAQLAVRRGSNDSQISQSSALSLAQSVRSSISSVDTCTGRKLPPALDQTTLPPLPPTKRELEEKSRQAREARASVVATKSAPAVAQIEWKKPVIAAPPPRLPMRPSKSSQALKENAASPVVRRLAPEPAPPMPQRPSSRPTTNNPSAIHDEPPAVPYASRPSQKQLEARKAQTTTSPKDRCFICRDFSGPDQLAASYPRQSNPRMSTEYLAHVLCDPFDSHTDKARAIFTWLHYNIDYDTVAFFGNACRPTTPENTIARGLAVCAGYAGLFVDIALKADLECVVVGGHGKGYGYNPAKGGSIPPRDPSGHAWNAVRIDGGRWKLIDACWGAGYLHEKKYVRKFSPENFISSNEDFGEKHFPEDARYFFRKDGRALTWEEYILGSNRCEPPQLCGVVEEYGISKTSFQPMQKEIKANTTGTTRFQFANKCLHWDHVKNGSGVPYCMILKIHGVDGRQDDMVPFDYDGTYWWADVGTKHLGTPTQKVHVYSVTTVNEKDVRGMIKQEYLSKKGQPGSMGFQTVATWDLV